MVGKILVVEDNELNQALIRDVLEYYGHEVIEAGNGAEGIERARECHPDLILLDIQMPVMDGFATIGALRNDPIPGLKKIIALTSFAMRGDRERIMAAGFDGYLTKPIDTRKLPQMVREWLGEEGEGG
ncbi:MAG: response regulator [Desulfurivibrionaceae bacterium]|jgi:CheY-like chemotaxis protein